MVVHFTLDLCDPRAARDRELEQRIRSHVQMIQERRRRPSGTAQEETEAARQDMEEVRYYSTVYQVTSQVIFSA